MESENREIGSKSGASTQLTAGRACGLSRQEGTGGLLLCLNSGQSWEPGMQGSRSSQGAELHHVSRTTWTNTRDNLQRSHGAEMVPGWNLKKSRPRPCPCVLLAYTCVTLYIPLCQPAPRIPQLLLLCKRPHPAPRPCGCSITACASDASAQVPAGLLDARRDPHGRDIPVGESDHEAQQPSSGPEVPADLATTTETSLGC